MVSTQRQLNTKQHQKPTYKKVKVTVDRSTICITGKKPHLGTGLLSLLPLSALLLLPRLFIKPDILLIALIAWWGNKVRVKSLWSLNDNNI